MPFINTEDIHVGKRFRKQFEEIEKLAASIEAQGLINPITIDEDNNLIAGERRLKAHQLLKKKTIYVRYIKGLDTLGKKEIELEENIQRKSFTWQEEVSARAELHKLKQKIHGVPTKGHKVEGTWRVKDTAEALGESAGVTSEALQLADGLKMFPELRKEKSKALAFKKLKDKMKLILHEERARRLKQRGLLDSPDMILGNCLEELAKVKSESVDLVLTDPPYGIDIGKALTFGRMTPQGTYEDGEFETFDLLDKVFPQLFRILRDNRHCFIFCGIDMFPQVGRLLTKHGFDVHPMPLIWYKGSGSYPSQGVSFVHCYEAFIHCRKGKRQLYGTPKDIFDVKRVPPNKKIHPTEKPTELLRDLIKLSTLPGEKVIDPFSGSGATIQAAKETNRQASGVEIDPSFYNLACQRLKEEKEEA